MKAINNRRKDIGRFMGFSLGSAYRPEHLLSDYDPGYADAFKKAKEENGQEGDIVNLKDFVHTKRQFTKLIDEGLGEINVKVPEGTMVKERKRQEKLKRRLLKKQINKILYRIKKGFVKGYEAVEGILLKGDWRN